MTWLFEWNWLGYLWAIFVGAPLAMATLYAYPEGKWIEQGKQGAGMLTAMMMVGSAAAAILFGLLTIFVWDMNTALWLAGGALVWVGLVFALFMLGGFVQKRR